MRFDEVIEHIFRLFVSAGQEQGIRDAFASPGDDLAANAALREEYYRQPEPEDSSGDDPDYIVCPECGGFGYPPYRPAPGRRSLDGYDAMCGTCCGMGKIPKYR